MEGQDLNELTYPCKYIARGGNLTSSLINTPQGIGGYGYFESKPFFNVKGTKGDAGHKACIQEWIDAGNLTIYLRSCMNNGSFTNWKQL